MSQLPSLLTVEQVATRYGWRDPRSARALMRRAGGFRVGQRLVVRAEDLDAYERAQREQAQAAVLADPPAPRRKGGPLPVGWWRE